MNQNWLFHNSQSLAYRSPFGAVCCNTEITLRLRILSSSQPESVVLRLWKDGLGEQKMDMLSDSKINSDNLYRVKLTVPDQSCVIWYYFIIIVGGKTFYYGNNHAGLGGSGDIYDSPPPSFQITVYQKGAGTPNWFKEAVMYQIFPDRFFNGEADGKILAPKKGSVIHADWSNTPYYIRDVDTKEIAAYDFFGGNLRGIINKLSYLKELGISVIYLNPIFESPSNHRYDTGDYHKVDSMLGDNELFAELCAKAKEVGIEIILDGVFSHTGSDSIYFNKYGNYKSIGAFQSQASPYYKWYRFSQHPDKYESWWGIDTLPNTEENEPSFVDFIISGDNSVLKYWLKQGIKGWRLDVVDELPDEFVKTFAKELKATDPDAVLIGEVWEDASHKESYGKLRDYLGGSELDSAMNYPFRKILLDFILGHADSSTTHRSLMSLYENYPRENFYAMMNLVGSHDVPRVLTLLGEAQMNDTLSITKQGKFRLNAEQRCLAKARLKLLALWQMTFPGVPAIYYGDECGVEGFKDPFNRSTYPWGQEDLELLKWYKKVIKLRNSYPVFKTGEWLPIYAEGDVYGYARRIINGKDHFGQERPDNMALVLLNRSKDSAAKITLDVRGLCRGIMKDVLNDRGEAAVHNGIINVELAPLEGKVLLQHEHSLLGRQCGILLHPTSLPSKYGIGDLGKEAYEFVNFLYKSKQKLWQILPLNPVGLGESPYQSPSAFAGNPLIISLGKLVGDGLLSGVDVKLPKQFDADKIEFEAVKDFKESCLRTAFNSFKQKFQSSVEYERFVSENAFWLHDYALFMALKKHFNDCSWTEWPYEIASRQEGAISEYSELLRDEIAFHYFLQFEFYKQWLALKRYANQWGVKIIGDMPIFVAHDSADVWANQQLFELDKKGLAQKIAGVPPDYFSETGQLWGNPHYNWSEMAKEDYNWWRERFRVMLNMVDIIRVDHFRGFEAYWEVPAGEKTAVNGKWIKGPGASLFSTLERNLGKLPIIAEDLGVITPEVEDLRDAFYYPGMKVLHFVLACDEEGCCIPFTCDKNSVVYTGTHDNNTTLGWYKLNVGEETEYADCINKILQMENADPEDVCWRMIEFAYNTNANTVIIPMQDVLCLGSEARMNTPGTVGGNWQWRCRKEWLTPDLAAHLAALTGRYKR